MGRSRCAAIIPLTPARSEDGARPLDDPTRTEPQAAAPPPPRGPRKPPPGLRAQLTSTFEAAKALLWAHVDLAKAESAQIAGEAGKVAGLVGLAIVLVIFAIFLFVIGVSLGIGEWVLGSMGWGVLHGVELFISVALAAILVALGISGRRIAGAFVVAVVIGIVVGVVLGLNLPNRAYAAIGESANVAVDPAYRPLVVGTLLWMAIGLIVGIVVAFRIPAGAGGRFVAIAGLVVAGAALGAFTSITFGPQVGAGIGIAVGYLAWIGLMALDVSRTGIDTEALKRRFTPNQTIETSKETLEWLQKRMPPGIGS
jgi:hypothetical protein